MKIGTVMLTYGTESLTAFTACAGTLLAARPNCQIDLPFAGHGLKVRLTRSGALKLVAPGCMVVVSNYVRAAQLGQVRIVDRNGVAIDLEALLWSNEARFEIG
jgi:hypothetical protein